MILKINDRIRNRTVEYFNNFHLNLKYDSVGSTFSFGFYFNPDNKEHVEMACVGHYHKCTVEHNNELLLTGIVLSEAFNNSSVRQLVAIGGYSLPGVLEDCQIPTSVYPLQYDEMSLREIAQKIIKPFGLKMVIDQSVSSKMEATYATTKAEPGQTVKQYLTELAAQKNIIISHTAKGELLFTEAKANKKPILEYNIPKGGAIPGTTMALNFNGQAMHSDITVMKQADKDGGNAGESSIKNPYVPYVFRPKVMLQSSGTDVDTEQAAKNALAQELKNMQLIITTDRWEVNGQLVKPNNTITVINPDIFLFKKTTWFIEEIDFTGDEKQTTAVMKCVLPEVYNGKTPKYIFDGINLH